jgi:hypothetical protein
MLAFTLNSSLLADFGLSTIVVALKAQFLGAFTAATRGKLKSFLNAEDAAWLGGAHINPDPEAVARLGRTQRNRAALNSSPQWLSISSSRPE